MVALRKELHLLREQVKNNEARLDETVDRISETDQRLNTLETDVKQDRVQDVYTFADQAERMDFASNLLKANCVLLTGIFSYYMDYAITYYSYLTYCLTMYHSRP